MSNSSSDSNADVAVTRYDFDKDGYVIQDDVRLILSHVPIENSINGHVAREGAFTQMGGGR